MQKPAPKSDDSILPFQLDRPTMRGRVVRMDGALDAILSQHAYPAPVAALVAEAALLTALIGQAVKLRWKFSLQLRGKGPLRLVAADYFAPDAEGGHARIRAFASFDAAALPEGTDRPFDLFGRGVFGVSIDQGAGTRPYQGITPLGGEALSDCAEIYFAQSEQLSTRFAIAAVEASVPGGAVRWRGGGIMVQHLPMNGGRAPDAPSGAGGLTSARQVAAMSGRAEDWSRIALLFSTVETSELVGPHIAPERLLLRLFHDERPRAWPLQKLAFGCTCSADRVRRALAQYSAKDIATMTDDDGAVTADCKFCGAHYHFAPADLGFKAARDVQI